ncbi:MAG: mucoidy inhibitor MuiA family protein [Spirochaetaceae bacterium]|nr:MAG: mucoidy inhibitor MuiA family protein [Spirochaetaceae bacterium]
MAALVYTREEIETKPNAALETIIIFDGYAQVTRSLKQELQSGASTVVFTSLGSTVQEDTVKAWTNTAGVKVMSVSLLKRNLYFFNRKEHEALYKKVVAQTKQLVEMFDEKMVLALEAHLASDLRLYLRNALNDILLDQHVAIQRLREALDFTAELLSGNRTRAVELSFGMKRAEEEYARLAADFDRVKQVSPRTTHEVIVELVAQKACTAELSCSYMAGGVSWKTTYDAFLDTQKNTIGFSVYGEICQASGEDWENVAAVLSTAETQRGFEIPKLYPLRLSGHAEQLSKDIVTGAEEIDELGEGIAEPEAGGEPQPAAEKPLAESVEKKGTSYTFTLARPATIPGDGLWHRFLVSRMEYAPSVYFETIPSMMEYVYLKCVFTNASGAPFPAGSVQVFRNGSYMGRTEIRYAADKEECSLSFGIDEDIKVKRTVISDVYTPPRTVMSGHKRKYSFRYELSHFKQTAVKVVLKEAIHVSEVDGVKVEIDKENTTEGFVMDKHGIISFEKVLEPGRFKREKLELAYTIEAPRKFSLEKV